jgi:hypothetical protein
LVRGSGKCALLLVWGLAQTSCGASGASPVAPRGDDSARPLALDPSALTLGHQSIPRSNGTSLQVRAQRQTYALPLQRKTVINLERDVLEGGILREGSPALERLLQRGMAIVPTPTAARRFDQAYTSLRDQRVPILVSADSVLHQQHIIFNEILKAVEERKLGPMLAALLDGLHTELAGEVRRSPRWEPALNELAVISVARKLLNPSLPVEPAVKSRVEEDLELIAGHQGLEISAAQSSAVCLRTKGEQGRCYVEDFSQYVPRGHYTVSEALQRYFRAMMWLGRIGRRLKYDDELAQQVLLVQAAKRARCKYEDKEVPAVELLGRLDQILQYFVGASDDLTLPEVDAVMRRSLGATSELRLSQAVLSGLRVELQRLRAPRILSGAVEAYGANAEATAKQETQGLRLLGQRFAPDSAMLGRLVFEHTGPDPEHARFAQVAKDAATVDRDDICNRMPAERRRRLPELSRTEANPEAWRCLCERSITLAKALNYRSEEEHQNRALTQVCRLMPSGLDVAAAMGSTLARRYTAPAHKYSGYKQKLTELHASYRADQSKPPSTLYQAWLSSIGPLLEPVPRDYPTWMAGTDYEKKSLRTFLASWAELRHDTILYVKQSYTTMGRVLVSAEFERPRPPEAYGLVEPRPELYRKLKLVSAQTRVFLQTLSVLPPEVATALVGAEEALDRLTQISVQQLEGKGLTPADEAYIKQIGPTLLGIATGLTVALNPSPPPPPATPTDNAWLDQRLSSKPQLDDVMTVPLVADVHTDLNTGRVLEEATGPLEWMVAVSRLPDGTLSVSVGPVFSYREFVHPLKDRLTNEKWRGPLRAGADLPAPRWWSQDRPLANGFELPCVKGSCK